MFHGFLHDIAFHTLLLPPGALCDIADYNLFFVNPALIPAYAFC
jgi:hypothetical protein